jgi:aspartate/methionine/tyrosine aminotransferase
MKPLERGRARQAIEGGGRGYVSPKMSLFPESMIREMTRLSDLNGAINLSQGFPDFPVPASIKAAAVRAIREDNNQYEVTWGSPELRDAIAEKAWRFNGIRATGKDNVTVTCGVTEGMVATIIALTDATDDVIIPEPFYECYVPSTVFSGARVRHVNWYGGGDDDASEGLGLDEEALKGAFAVHEGGRRPKAIIVNTPNNPTGKVLSKGELKLVADLCEDNGVLAITDEIYEQIIYDGQRHNSMATIGDMADRTVTISGMSKTYGVTGWRLGYTVAEKELSSAIRTIHDFLTVCAPSPLQRAAIEALKLDDSYYSRLTRSYERKRDYMIRSLEAMGLRCMKPQGAYYIMADFSEVWKDDDYAFAESMVKNGGVATVPASSFYSTEGLGRSKVRLAFPKQDKTLREAIERMQARI